LAQNGGRESERRKNPAFSSCPCPAPSLTATSGCCSKALKTRSTAGRQVRSASCGARALDVQAAIATARITTNRAGVFISEHPLRWDVDWLSRKVLASSERSSRERQLFNGESRGPTQLLQPAEPFADLVPTRESSAHFPQADKPAARREFGGSGTAHPVRRRTIELLGSQRRIVDVYPFSPPP
jgi:hypothetical protein